MVERLGVRFTVRVRRVGGYHNKTTDTVREALGFTIPTVVCEDLRLKKGDKVKVEVKKVEG